MNMKCNPLTSLSQGESKLFKVGRGVKDAKNMVYIFSHIYKY
jgi:hypothetical protein